MSKTKSQRTDPLDRDGDGKRGGSLPGNKTAPMADAAEQADTSRIVQDPTVLGGEATIRGLRIRVSDVIGMMQAGETDASILAHHPDLEAEDLAAVRATFPEDAKALTDWTRDDALIVLKLDAAGVRDHDEDALISVEQVTQWPDEDARAAEAFADAMLAEGSHTDDQGDERRADGSLIELPAILAERHVLPREGKAPETSSDEAKASDDTPEVAKADPAADAASGDELADARTTPGDTADKLEAMERETDEANAAARDAMDAIAEAEPEIVANATADQSGLTEEGETPIEQDDAADTFTAEEIAAGQTEVIEAEGEETATAANQVQTLDPADPVTTLDTETAPIAVRLSELAQLTGSKRLYLTASGYSATHSAPFIETATVDGWVAAGLAEFIPSAGNTGGVKATDAARRLERQLRAEKRNAA